MSHRRAVNSKERDEPAASGPGEWERPGPRGGEGELPRQPYVRAAGPAISPREGPGAFGTVRKRLPVGPGPVRLPASLPGARWLRSRLGGAGTLLLGQPPLSPAPGAGRRGRTVPVSPVCLPAGGSDGAEDDEAAPRLGPKGDAEGGGSRWLRPSRVLAEDCVVMTTALTRSGVPLVSTSGGKTLERHSGTFVENVGKR